MRYAAVSRDCTSVRTVEETVKSFIGPIYEKFHLVPDELLRIADCSVSPVQHPPAPSRTTASDIAGAVYSKCKPVAMEAYDRFGAKVEHCAETARQRLFPPAPKTSCWTEKYNEKIVTAAKKSCRVPALVPPERIARMLSDKRVPQIPFHS
ncbi:stress-related protein-like [Vigna unguiculata]|uniref:Rubber elongation factor n=1 Tax=Vigna unguiculata TaxID=3917 RepID=A0A4D6L755_VIGUN|nr:stress-related protein-like [Vigna unguiculata]QCD84342.1 Rubber elongation factor [Vigna unguiculata]